MPLLPPGIQRVFRLLPRARADIYAELADELRFHLEARAAELRAAGLSESDAWNEAVRRVGSLDHAHRRLHATAQRREGRMHFQQLIDALVQDTRFVARQLLRSPAFTLTVALTLALGVGANATMFGVLDRLLLRPPEDVRQPERLARLSVERTAGFGGRRTWQQTNYSYADYRDLRDAHLGLDGVAGYWATSTSLGRGIDAQRLRIQLTTSEYFDVLGTKPLLGRFFVARDAAEPVGAPVVVLGYGFWQRQFAGARDVLGREVLIGPRKYTVIGIAPRYFGGLSVLATDAWLPVTAAHGIAFGSDDPNWLTNRNSQWLTIVARLPLDSQRVVRAATQSKAIFAALPLAGNDTVLAASFTPALRKLAARDNPDVRVARLLMIVSAFVLLIACANVANLMLGRAVRRRHEIAVRLALGISAHRLSVMLLAESVMLALLGGALSLLVVHFGGAIVRARLLAGVTVGPTSLVGARVLLFTGAVTLVVVLLIGVVPLLQSLRASVTTVLGNSARTTGGRRGGLRSALIVTQVSLCTVLLVGTGLFIASLNKLNDLRLGMDTRQVLVVQTDLSAAGRAPDQIPRAFLGFAERVRALPGVKDAAVGMSLPFGSSYAARLSVPGLTKLPRVSDGGPYYQAVDEHYFTALGTRIVRGRGISAADRAAGARVAVVNESMASLYWPAQDAVGKCIKVGGDTMPCSTVVGVVENARRQSLIEGVSVQYFVPLEVSPGPPSARVLFVRVAGNPDDLIESVRRVVQGAASDSPFASVRPMQSLLEGDFKPWTLGSSMFGAFGLVALVLAAVGLYGSLTYDVAQRRRELSVRIALGAQQRDVVRLVMGKGIGLVAGGVLTGAIVALFSGRWIADLLYQVSPRDPNVLALTAAVLLVTAIVATALPALRGARTNLREAMSAE